MPAPSVVTSNENTLKKVSEKRIKGKVLEKEKEKKVELESVPTAEVVVSKEVEKKTKVEVKVDKKKTDNVSSVPRKQQSGKSETRRECNLRRSLNCIRTTYLKM